jgi:TRAP-type C4-dicarboxylate transport system permease small subunit
MFIVGIGLCATSDHLRITIIEEMQTGWLKTANKIIVELLTFIFYILLAYGTFLLASKSRQQIATLPPLKMAYVYWLLPITSVLSAISVLISLIAELTNKGKGGEVL